jgi:hypothetical protein
LIKKVIFLSFLRPISTFFSNFAAFFERNISFLTTPSQIQSSPQVSSSHPSASSPSPPLPRHPHHINNPWSIYHTLLYLISSAKLVFFSNHHHFMPDFLLFYAFFMPIQNFPPPFNAKNYGQFEFQP